MVGVLRPERRIGVDVERAPANTQIPTGRTDERLGFHTEVTTGPSQEQDPRGWVHYLPARRR